MKLISKTDKGTFIFEISKEDVKKYFREYESYYSHEQCYEFKAGYLEKQNEILNNSINYLRDFYLKNKEIVDTLSACGVSLSELINNNKLTK